MKYYFIIFMAFVLSVNTVVGQKKKSKKELVMQLLMDAKSAKYEGDTVLAITKLKEVLRINPNDTNACGRLGKIHANPYSQYFNKSQAIKYYNLVLENSKSEENKRIAHAQISKLAKYEDKQDNIEQTEVSGTVVDVVNPSVHHSNVTTETEKVQDRYSKMIEEHNKKQKNKNEEIDNLQNTNEVTSSEESIYDQRLRKHLEKKEEEKNNEGIKIVPIPPKPTPQQPVIDDGVSSESFLMRDTLITYIPPYDILKEDIKLLKTAECPKNDGTQYVSALFNHQTARDAIVFLFDNQENLSIHRDCDLMVGYREIVRNGMQDVEKHVKVRSNTKSPNEWSVVIEFNLPDSVLNDPSWSKNVYRMMGVYFNQSALVEKKLIEQANKVCQNGKTLKISYKFELEPINGILHGETVVRAEKIDGCKCLLAYSESNQLFALATDDYRIANANTSNIQKIEVDDGLANDANHEYQKLCAFHQQIKGDKRYFTKYVNQLDALAKANQPEALYTSYVAYKHGLWHIKKMQGNMKWALKCQEKIISMQKYLKKNYW